MLKLVKRVLMENKLLDTTQAAKFLGVHPISMARWRGKGKGPEYLVLNGYFIRYEIDALRKFKTKNIPPKG